MTELPLAQIFEKMAETVNSLTNFETGYDEEDLFLILAWIDLIIDLPKNKELLDKLKKNK